jgi:hypothetical protein
MTKFVKIWGFLLGAAIAFHGCALAITGNRLLPSTTRGGSQHYWNTLVGVFGERDAALVSGGFWFAIGIVFIYFAVAPTRKHPQSDSKSKRGHRRRT